MCNSTTTLKDGLKKVELRRLRTEHINEMMRIGRLHCFDHVEKDENDWMQHMYSILLKSASR